MSTGSRPNRLANESSPYLRQHAGNPVDWYPWGAEAIERAKRENRPIFLSIGYSACHWCHVMERESFEDPEIASLMNDLYVNIKVDREERPDLDRIYMRAVQLMTGSGGWPMSVFLTPDLRPFYAGTYFPPDDRYGRPGFPLILKAAAEAYRTRRDEVEEASSVVVEEIRSLSLFRGPDELLSPALIDGAVQHLSSTFDAQNGGFGSAPKFPQSVALQLLMRQYLRAGDIEALRMVRLTLEKMAAGGIYDQIGGGFHRYSTDAHWLVPHFEKMLYDNALLAIAYLEAYQLTGSSDYGRIAREVLDFMAGEMRDPGGGFYASQDADSEGGEGVFYTWSVGEVRRALDGDDAELFTRAYDVDEVGNFDGRSILHRVKSDVELATITGRDEEEVRLRLDLARRRLLEVRQERAKPFRDEKILVDWNGLALSAFARGARALGEARYREVAEQAACFLLAEVRDGKGNLLHVWTEGEARVDAFLDDYASLFIGCVDLYEATGERRWLHEATDLEEVMVREFWDETGGGFFDTSSRHGELLARSRHAEDGTVPSGNALAAYGMIRLARITARTEGLKRAEQVLRSFAQAMRVMPGGTSQMLVALDLHLAEAGKMLWRG